ncbi:MAG: ornithine--oxo-acid transaminase [Candidatus Hodarchaeales archaeon]
MPSSQELMEKESDYGAHNYHPLPVVISKAEGVWVWDPEGKKYLDCLSAYSAVNQGHRHPKIIEALKKQLDTLTLTSRAFYNDRLGPYLKQLCELTGFEVALPMNTGAEAVETGMKIARKWGYEIKGVSPEKAEIITCENNFHGRTITIISFSTDPTANKNFGPYTPGFITIPFNDVEALKNVITPNTVAFMVEPIQGEAGVIIPDEGYLRRCREICDIHGILLILDEIQTGLGRTGKLFCHQHEGIKPDIMLLGKALGGGILPVSAVVSNKDIMKVMTPGTHGSTFGGNPLACAVGMAALDVFIDEDLSSRAAELGNYFFEKVKAIRSDKIKEVRAKGLFLAVELKKEAGKARPFTEEMKDLGILAKETHEQTIRFAPPLVIKKKELDSVIEIIEKVLT